MPETLRLRGLWMLILVASAACGRDEVQRHVYQSPPPASATPPASSPSPPVVPEAPIGTTGPIARVVSMSLASTGGPVSLDHVDASFMLLALASRGQGSSPVGPMRLELHLVGPLDTVIVQRLDTPVPLVIAHQFTVAVGDVHGLRAGAYRATVSLVSPARRLVASSTPLYFAVSAK